MGEKIVEAVAGVLRPHMRLDPVEERASFSERLGKRAEVAVIIAEAALTALATAHPGIGAVLDGSAVVVPPPGEWITRQRAGLLWCVHVIGPDDVLAAESYDDAVKQVESISADLARKPMPPDVTCLPVVALYPGTAGQHAADLLTTSPYRSAP